MLYLSQHRSDEQAYHLNAVRRFENLEQCLFLPHPKCERNCFAHKNSGTGRSSASKYLEDFPLLLQLNAKVVAPKMRFEP